MGLEDIAEQIRDALEYVDATFRYLGNRAKLDGKFGYRDFSKNLEDFCRVFFLAMRKFKELEVSYDSNESAVDLAGIDQNGNNISIQVTSTQKDNAQGKIKKTLKAFKKKQQKLQIKKDKKEQLTKFEEYSLKSKKLLIVFIVDDDIKYTKNISDNYDFEYEVLDNKKLVIECIRMMTDNLKEFISKWNSNIAPLFHTIPTEKKDLYSNVINAILSKRQQNTTKKNKKTPPPKSINGKIGRNNLEGIKSFIQDYYIDKEMITEIYEDNELHGGRPSSITAEIKEIYDRIIIDEVNNSNNLEIFYKIVDKLYNETLNYPSLEKVGKMEIKDVLRHLICIPFIECKIYPDVTK